MEDGGDSTAICLVLPRVSLLLLQLLLGRGGGLEPGLGWCTRCPTEVLLSLCDGPSPGIFPLGIQVWGVFGPRLGHLLGLKHLDYSLQLPVAG